MEASLGSLGLISDWNFKNGFNGVFTGYQKTRNGYEIEGRVGSGRLKIAVNISGSQVKSARISFFKGGASTSAKIDNINRPASVVEKNLSDARNGLKNIISDWTRGDDQVILWDERIKFDAGSGDDIINAGNSNTVLGGRGNDWIVVSANPSRGTSATAYGGSGSDGFHVLAQPSWKHASHMKIMDFEVGRDAVRIFDLGINRGEKPLKGSALNLQSSGNDTFVLYQGKRVATVVGRKNLSYRDLGIEGGSKPPSRDPEPEPTPDPTPAPSPDPTQGPGREPGSKVGTMQGERIYGDTGKNNKIYGLGGPDYLAGMGEDDTLIGGAGRDSIYGSMGNDELRGGNGGDHLWAGSGNDIIKAGAGADTISGGSGADAITGGGGKNVIFAGAKNDSERDIITVLTDGNYLGNASHQKADYLSYLGANDRIIMDVNSPATLAFGAASVSSDGHESYGGSGIGIFVDGQLEAVVAGLSQSQVKAMTTLG